MGKKLGSDQKIKSSHLDVSRTHICGIKERRDEHVNQASKASELGIYEVWTHILLPVAKPQFPRL